MRAEFGRILDELENNKVVKERFFGGWRKKLLSALGKSNNKSIVEMMEQAEGVEFLDEERSELIYFVKCTLRQQLNRATLNLTFTPNTYIPKLNIALSVTKNLISLVMFEISLVFYWLYTYLNIRYTICYGEPLSPNDAKHLIYP